MSKHGGIAVTHHNVDGIPHFKGVIWLIQCDDAVFG